MVPGYALIMAKKVAFIAFLFSVIRQIKHVQQGRETKETHWCRASQESHRQRGSSRSDTGTHWKRPTWPGWKVDTGCRSLHPAWTWMSRACMLKRNEAEGKRSPEAENLHFITHSDLTLDYSSQLYLQQLATRLTYWSYFGNTGYNLDILDLLWTYSMPHWTYFVQINILWI